ncbi:MAG: hypothetical protein ACI4PM_00665 [Butyricicoccus sp.]
MSFVSAFPGGGGTNGENMDVTALSGAIPGSNSLTVNKNNTAKTAVVSATNVFAPGGRVLEVIWNTSSLITGSYNTGTYAIKVDVEIDGSVFKTNSVTQKFDTSGPNKISSISMAKVFIPEGMVFDSIAVYTTVVSATDNFYNGDQTISFVINANFYEAGSYITDSTLASMLLLES